MTRCRVALPLLVLLAALPASADPVSALFGSRVTEHTGFKAPYLTADFDGDGVPDAVYIVAIAPESARKTLAPNIAIAGFQTDAPHLDKQGDAFALAIVQGKSKRKTLVTGPFDTPIWTVSPPPVSVAIRGSQAFKDFQKQEKHIANDVLVLGTEAGIDVALYWNGKAFVEFAPNEEP